MKEKLPKEKKPNFWQKLKAKIDKVFENDELTFVGQIFMLGVYAIPLILGVLIALSVGTQLTECILVAGGVSFTFHLSGIKFLLGFAFVVDLAVVLLLGIWETYVFDCDGKSVLSLEKKEDEDGR